MKKRITIIACIIISFCLVSVSIFYKNNLSTNVFNSMNIDLKDKLIVHYIDVDQGDCQILQINDSCLLIDSGSKKYGNKVCNYIKSLGIKNIDCIIATHPHEDHIGSMSKIIKNFNVGMFLAPKVTSNSKTFEEMINTLKSKNLKINIAKAGMYFNLSPDVKCEILAPNNTKYDDINNYSVVIKISFNDTSFLFTGDAEKISENEILNKDYCLKSNVIKIGHHGSNSSSSLNFLKCVDPEIAIISCGKNNKFNHPHSETLNKLNSLDCKIFRTDKNGSIILISDGTTITQLLQ